MAVHQSIILRQIIISQSFIFSYFTFICKFLPQNIFWLDYCDDEAFMNEVSGNFMELVQPNDMFDMIESGYNHMKREHHYDRLPFLRKSIFSRETLHAAVEVLPKLPMRLMKDFNKNSRPNSNSKKLLLS